MNVIDLIYTVAKPIQGIADIMCIFEIMHAL